jgi:NAD-dependent dihydropyrimidine dehydrogenase PreA subunit
MEGLGSWKGIPRVKIPWFPTVDEQKCAGCQECFEFCSHEVYAWDAEKGKTRVAQPYRCVVGCSTCAGLCKEGAISFPPLTILKNLGS